MNYQGPGHYRHYKGGEYEVLGLGMEEATHTTVVIYIAHAFQIPDPEVLFWTRPLDDFNATVNNPGDCGDSDCEGCNQDVAPVPRFIRLY